MNYSLNYSAFSHQLYNQEIPIKVVKRTHNAQDQELCLHSHDYMELAIVTNGSAIHSVILPNQKPYNYRIERGNFFLINTNEQHNFLFTGNEHLILENILFAPSVLKQIKFDESDGDFSFLSRYYSSFQLPLDQRFKQAYLSQAEFNTLSLLISNLKLQCNSTDKGHTDKQLLLLMLILCYTQSQLSPIKNASDKQTSITRLIAHLQHHYADDFTLDELCKIALCGKRHLTRQFKIITNETTTEFITRLRINNACIMLVNTDLNITTIATKVGFHNSSFFGKRFKEQTGYSPKEYREKLQALSPNI